MSTTVKLKRSLVGNYVRQGMAEHKGQVVFECEIVHPPSKRGQTVWLHLDVQDVTDALVVLRNAAIAARR